MIKGNSNKLFQRGSLIVVIILFGLIIAKLFYVAVSPTVDGVDLKAFALTRTTAVKKVSASRAMANSGPLPTKRYLAKP